MAKARRSGFPNSGIKTMAVTIAHCVAIEIAKARRRMRRSRARCSALPSTKQPCREPKSCRGLGPGSIDITHLHRKVLRERTGIVATPVSCGLLNYRRRPAPRSQGCEVRASSVILDTGRVDKFPSATCKRCPFVRKPQQRRVVRQFPVRTHAPLAHDQVRKKEDSSYVSCSHRQLRLSS